MTTRLVVYLALGVWVLAVSGLVSLVLVGLYMGVETLLFALSNL